MKLSIALLSLTVALAQNPDPGQQSFESRCVSCHGGDGAGGEHGPAIVFRLARRTDPDLARLIREGLPNRGMPAFNLADREMNDLIGFLRTLRPRRPQPTERAKVDTTEGRALEGLVLNQSSEDMQLQTDDKRVHLLRKTGAKYREVTSQNDWPSYNGETRGYRYSKLDQINRSNVSRLAPKWVFTLPNTAPLQATPVVAGGIMYITSANECYALDAGSGRRIWHYERARTRNLTGNAAGGINRGVALSGDRIFMVTDHAHVIALNRLTGDLLWETALADWQQNYSASSAPLPAGNLLISGVSGGEHGANGFVAAHDQETGKEVWRFSTVPARGQPGSETWQGKDIEHGGAPTWFTGSYDPELDTVYWPTGNPSKEYNGDHRKGDNLYSDCILALERKTGQLKWYYQFTPHDLWDWDITETPVLVDAAGRGQTRKLMLQANRNGFFYV